MGIRQLRLWGARELTEANLRPLIGRDVDVMRLDREDIRGELQAVNDQAITLADPAAAGLRKQRHLHRISLSDIRELHYYDYVAY